MIHQWILKNGICITFHTNLEWLQIDTLEDSEIEQLPSVRFYNITNSIDTSKESGVFYWNDYAKYYTEGNFQSKGEPFSFYMRRNKQFQRVYENTKHIKYLRDMGFDLVYLRDRRYNDRKPRINWSNFENASNIKSYRILDNYTEVESRYKNTTTFFQRYADSNSNWIMWLTGGVLWILFIILLFDFFA